jgi:hypothetical protein
MLVQEGQELELDTGHIVRPFPTVHPVPSQVKGLSHTLSNGPCQHHQHVN